jgi:hypothetical protein
MKAITILITAGLIFTASAQSGSTTGTTDTSKKSDSKKAVRTPESPKIPADATLLPDGSYRYVDKDGKKWIYRTTPFGVSKAEERPAAPVAQIVDDPARSEDLGDSVRFTRPTPFGSKVWTKKKTELDSYEKSIVDRDRQRLSANTAQSGDAAKRDAAK